MKREATGRKIRNSHFPVSMFFGILLVLLLMSGVHVGLIVGINTLELGDVEQTLSIIVYWVMISAFVTLWLGRQIRKVYEDPMKQMAEVAGKVADGDFSVYIPPLHTPEKLDYLDVMIMDFNRMVEELGSIETLKTDFLSNVSHEIKTPIAVIQNAAEMLKHAGLSAEEQQMYVDTIIQSSILMKQISITGCFFTPSSLTGRRCGRLPSYHRRGRCTGKGAGHPRYL